MSLSGNRHMDGWNAYDSAQEVGKKTGKKLSQKETDPLEELGKEDMKEKLDYLDEIMSDD